MLGASESLVVGGTAGYMQWHSRIYGGGLFDYSVKPGPDFVNFKARFGHLVTRLVKARARSLTILIQPSKNFFILNIILTINKDL